MDCVRQSLLETLWYGLLNPLWYNAVPRGVALGRASVVDSVRNTLLDALGELLLGLAWDNGVAGCVRLIHTGVSGCCGFGFDKLSLDVLEWNAGSVDE